MEIMWIPQLSNLVFKHIVTNWKHSKNILQIKHKAPLCMLLCSDNLSGIGNFSECMSSERLVEDLPSLDILLMPHHRPSQQGISLCCPSNPSSLPPKSHSPFHFYCDFTNHSSLWEARPWSSPLQEKKNWEREGRLVKVVLEKGFQEKVGRRWLDKCYLSVFLSEGFGASFHVVKSNDTENSFTFTIGISFWVGHHKLLSKQSTLSLSSWDTCSHAGIDLPCDPPLSLQYNLLYHNRSWPKWHLLRQFIKVCTDAFGIEACFCQPTKKWIHIVITDMIFIYYYL